MHRINFILALSLLLTMLACPTYAEATDKADLAVGLRTLSQLTTKIKGYATVAIVFNATSDASRKEAEAVQKIFDQGLDGPEGLKLTGILVRTQDLYKLAGTKIAFIAQDIPINVMSHVSASAAEKGIVSFTTTIDYVKNESCILGVNSKPNIQIFYSKGAAENAKVVFGESFTMLVTQI